MNYYIALTIGPIYKTINSSQRTRMLWGASFLFSYLIRELTKLLKTGQLNETLHTECKLKGTILIPYAENIENDTCIAGEGKYPDRLLINSEEGDFEKFQKAIEVLIKFLAAEIANHLNIESKSNQIEKDLLDYLQFYFIEKEIKENENALLSLYNDLDVLELRGKYLASDTKDYLFRYLFYISIKNRGKYSQLAGAAFPDKENKRFRSLIEISTSGFSKIEEEEYSFLIEKCFIEPAKKDIRNSDWSFRDKPFDDDDEWQDLFISELKEIKGISKRYRKPHQYVAVIYIDGDYIGSTLAKIGGIDSKLIDFSEKLLKFNTDTVTIINDYGGAPVYIGGDDTYAFVPLVSIEKGEQVTIFNLIKNIDIAFGEHFTENYAKDLGVVRPTLSFGVAICYYKNPLNETMQMAHSLLKKAKNETGRNAIELVLKEHSGQQFSLSIKKCHDKSYKAIYEIIGSLTKKTFSKEDEDKQEKSFTNSITHKLKDPLFKALLLSVVNDRQRLDEFFKNSFNESIHRSETGIKYLSKIKDLITTIFTDYQGKNEVCIENIYSTLRLIDFMHKNPKDE